MHSFVKYGNLHEVVFLSQIPQKFCRNKPSSLKGNQCLLFPLGASAVRTGIFPVQVDYISIENAFNLGYCLSGENYRGTSAF